MIGLQQLVKVARQSVNGASVSSVLYRSLSGKVSVNGADLAYEKVGTGKKVVLLLPGALGTCTTDFAPQIEGLNREKLTLVCWEPRGYGRSIPPKRDFPVNFFLRDAEDAAELMRKLGFTKYSLAGWSDGGNTAAIMAAWYADHVEKLVLWGSNAFITKEELEEYEKIRNIDSWSQRMKMPMVDIYGEDYFREVWSDWIDAWVTLYEEREGDVCIEELERIKAPTLIIHGMKDPLVPKYHPKYFHENIKGSIVDYWPEGKHNLHLRFPEKFNAQLEKFLLGE